MVIIATRRKTKETVDANAHDRKRLEDIIVILMNYKIVLKCFTRSTEINRKKKRRNRKDALLCFFLSVTPLSLSFVLRNDTERVQKKKKRS
jgi:hypothetical protein